jgi:alpha-L-rhamnosidase
MVDIRGEFTGFPLEEKSRFSSDQSWLNPIVSTGIRTARLCAHETYFDCPYYEQLQYVGDTRIQCLTSYYTFGEDRLAKQAIRALYNSRQPEGFTASRYPTKDFQIIPTFSLLWVGLLYDFWKYRDEEAFVKEMLPGTRTVLEFFQSHCREDGALQNVPWWNFIDWSGRFKRGVPAAGKEGLSAHMDLLHLHALQMAFEMEQKAGNPELAKTYAARIERLKSTIQNLYFDKPSGLFADVPEKSAFSQHVNSMAVLTGVCPPEIEETLMRKTFTDTSLAPCTIYYKYYLHLAGAKAGLGNEYLNWLGEWKAHLALGLTTWAEESEPSRSDCHAWGCSPNIEFFRTVLGVDSDAPGFALVKIAPHLGSLKKAEGKVPHPKGFIEVKYSVGRKGTQAEVDLPAGLYGNLVWGGKTYNLTSGKQILQLP